MIRVISREYEVRGERDRTGTQVGSVWCKDRIGHSLLLKLKKTPSQTIRAGLDLMIGIPADCSFSHVNQSSV